MLPAKRSWLLYRAAALSACLEPIAGEWAVIKLTYEPRDFWTVLQEIGIDFALGAELLGGFGGCCPLSASLTWGNAGVLWCFGLVRPAKPPRSCKQSSRVARGGAAPKGASCVGGLASVNRGRRCVQD